MRRRLTLTSAVITGLLAAAFVMGGAESASAVAPTPTCNSVSCTITFASTGSAQTFVVPSGVTSISATVDGAQGGGASFGAGAGAGGRTVGTIAVVPGDTLTLVVGGAGAAGGEDLDNLNVTPAVGGFGGGGTGGGHGLAAGGGGGGGSLLFADNGSLLIAAGGGGGSGGGGGGAGGGAGADATRGGDGRTGDCGRDGAVAPTGGAAATVSTNGAGGAAGSSLFGDAHAPGGNGTGPAASSTALAVGGAGGDGGSEAGGGGGGGYRGGGGGGGLDEPGCVYAAGGGGGAGFAASSATSVTGAAGVKSGDGQISLAYLLPAHTLTFNSEGGSAVASEAVTDGTNPTQPADPTKAHSTFGGWFTDETFATAFNFSTPLTGDETAYAKWTGITHTVTFDSEGGSAVVSEVVNDGDPAVQPADPTKTGSTFDGWFDAASAGTAWDFSTAITADTTIYAQWTLDTETVTFDSLGGSAVAPQSVPYGGTATQPADPTRAGFIFAGWFPDAAGAPQFDFSLPITHDLTIHAEWDADPAITLSSSTVVRGGQVTVSGTDFPSTFELDITIHSVPIDLGTVMTDATGAFSKKVTIPTSIPAGAHTIVVDSAGRGGRFNTSAPITVTDPPVRTGGLAFTGSDSGPVLVTALALLLGGISFLFVRMRRHRA